MINALTIHYFCCCSKMMLFCKQVILLLVLIISYAAGQLPRAVPTTSGKDATATTFGQDGVSTSRQDGDGRAATTHSQDRDDIRTATNIDTDAGVSMTYHLSTTPSSGLDKQIYYESRPEPGFDFNEISESYNGIHIAEFDGVTGVNLCINTLSFKIHSCKDRCGKPYGDPKYFLCGCDDECYKYNDCCPDYEIECLEWKPLITSMANMLATPATTLDSDIIDYLTTDITLTTDKSPTTTQEPYVRLHKEIFDKLDFVLMNIPDVVRDRPINKNLTETCTNITIDSDLLYFMVSACPENSSYEENRLCEGRSEFHLPVYSKSDSLFYANKFCATCNGKVDGDFEYVRVTCEWTCRTQTSPFPKDAPETLQECHETTCFSVKISFHPKPRICNIITTNCPITNDPISRVCLSYAAPVYGRNDLGVVDLYKNSHCAHCNGITEMYNPPCEPTEIPRDPGRAPGSPGGLAGSQPGGTPLTVLFDFSGGTLQKRLVYGGRPNPVECPEHFMYHQRTRRCFRVSCPTGSAKSGQKCIPSTDVYHTNRTEFSSSYRKITIKLGGKDINTTDEQIIFEINQLTGIRYLNVEHYSIKRYQRNNNVTEEIRLAWDGRRWKKTENIAEEVACDYRFIFEVILEGEATYISETMELGIDNLGQYLKFTRSCNPTIGVLQLKYSNFPHARYLCNSSTSIPRVYDETSFTRMENNGIQIIRIEFPENKTINSSIVPQEVVFTAGETYINQYNQELVNWRKIEMVYLCEETPSCILITLSSDEYLWNFTTDDSASLVVILETERRVVPNNETFLTHDGQVQVCLENVFVHEVPVFYTYSNGQTFATTIGCSISIILLAIVIATYCTFPSLRNIPGKTVLNLSISLFLAQLLLLVGADKTALWKVCLIIACAMHFLWLSVFTWTNILAFDLAQTFGKKATIRSDENNGALFFKYSVYGWGIPFTIVTITTLLHFYGDNLRIRGNLYGIEHICWLRGGNPVLLVFGVPVAGALLVNIMFFVRTVHGIRSTTKMMAMFQKKDTQDNNVDLEFMKKELYLYIRLSITIGLTWISGFITPYTGIEELGYLFIILNSLQGPVIFLSFTFSRRVGKLWRNKLGCGDSLGTTSADRSTTGTTAGSRTATAQSGHSVIG